MMCHWVVTIVKVHMFGRKMNNFNNNYDNIMKTLFQTLLLLFLISFSACNQCTDTPTDTTDPNNNSSNSELFYNYYIDKDNMNVFRCNADGSGQRLFNTTTGIISSIYNITSSPRKGKILLATKIAQSNNVQMIIANTDGTDAKVIPNVDTDWYPVLSPNATSILCSKRVIQGNSSAITIVNTDGTNLKQLADDMQRESSPFFSPDGKKVAYYTHDDAIGIVNTDGSGKEIIATDAAAYADNSSFLGFSPDGQEIVYMQRNAQLNDYTGIAIINITTKQVRVLYSSTEVTSGQPQWSPDGKSITYIRGKRGDGNITTQLIVCSPDGTNEKVAFEQSQPPLCASLPQWSPDSKKISITVSDDRELRPEAYKSLRVIDLQTGNITLLGNNMIYAYWAY